MHYLVGASRHAASIGGSFCVRTNRLRLYEVLKQLGAKSIQNRHWVQHNARGDFHRLWILWLRKAFEGKVEEGIHVQLSSDSNLRKSGDSHCLHPMDLPLLQNASVMHRALALPSNSHG